MTVRPAKTQISLGICPVWSESSLYAQWVAKDPSFLHADSEDESDWVDAQADLSLRWVHMPFCLFCHEAAHIPSELEHRVWRIWILNTNTVMIFYNLWESSSKAGLPPAGMLMNTSNKWMYRQTDRSLIPILPHAKSCNKAVPVCGDVGTSLLLIVTDNEVFPTTVNHFNFAWSLFRDFVIENLFAKILICDAWCVLM